MLWYLIFCWNFYLNIRNFKSTHFLNFVANILKWIWQTSVNPYWLKNIAKTFPIIVLQMCRSLLKQKMMCLTPNTWACSFLNSNKIVKSYSFFEAKHFGKGFGCFVSKTNFFDGFIGLNQTKPWNFEIFCFFY